MTLKRIILIFAVLTVSVLPLSAAIEWLATEYDFGVIHEIAGPQTGEVRFVNTGPEPTSIVRVRPSCGCTSADFTPGIILPGDTAIVSFTYDPRRLPGRFEKTVKVTVGEQKEMTVIKIKGMVVGTPETLSFDYPLEAGAIRASTRKISAGKVRYGTARHLFFQLVNQTAQTAWPVIEYDCEALEIEAPRDSIPPGDVLSISVYFNSRLLNEPGELEIPVKIYDRATPGQYIEIPFVADVQPNFDDLSPEEEEMGARAYLHPELLDLGYIRKGEKSRETTFQISNEGKKPLQIIRVVPKSPYIKILSYPTFIQPGKKGTARLRINFENLPVGGNSLKVDITGNDPLHPVRTLRISFEKE